jgi:DNA repair protein RecO (recombination protein O)
MHIHKTEGVILQALNFQDYDKILTVFSPDEGIVKFIVKGASRSKSHVKGLTEPLTHAEFVYTKGKSELYKCQEISAINSNHSLRLSLPVLEAACDLLQAILSSQFPHTPAPQLYKLLNSYLERLNQMQDPHLLATSFRLKLLRHDGLLKFDTYCAACSQPLNDCSTSIGEFYCRTHAPEYSIAFSESDAAMMFILAHCKTFAELIDLPITPTFRLKIIQLFKEVACSQ